MFQCAYLTTNHVLYLTTCSLRTFEYWFCCKHSVIIAVSCTMWLLYIHLIMLQMVIFNTYLAHIPYVMIVFHDMQFLWTKLKIILAKNHTKLSIFIVSTA